MNSPISIPWPVIQERIDALGVKNFKAKITNHGWGSVTMPHGYAKVIKHGAGGHGEYLMTPERLVFGVLHQVATHRPDAPVYAVDGNKLKVGTIGGQWTVYLDSKEDPTATLYAEQWRSQMDEEKWKEQPPRKKVVVDHKRLIEWLNENPDQACY